MINFVPIDGQPPNWYLTVGELVAQVEEVGTGRHEEDALQNAARKVAKRFEHFRGDVLAGFRVRDELNPLFPDKGEREQCTISGTIVRLNRQSDGALEPLAAQAVPENVLDIN